MAHSREIDVTIMGLADPEFNTPLVPRIEGTDVMTVSITMVRRSKARPGTPFDACAVDRARIRQRGRDKASIHD